LQSLGYGSTGIHWGEADGSSSGMLARVSVLGQSKTLAERSRLGFFTRDEPAVADLHRRSRQAAGGCILRRSTSGCTLRIFQSRSSLQFIARQQTCHDVPILSKAFSVQISSALDKSTCPGPIGSPACCCARLKSRPSLIWGNLVVVYGLSFRRVQNLFIFLQKDESFSL
jgi:hypothetical protein